LATRGYAAPEVEETYARARALCQEAGDSSQLYPVLIGHWLFHLVRAEFATAREMAVQLLGLAQGSRDLSLLASARNALGTTLYYQGEFARAHEHLKQGTAAQERNPHRSKNAHYGGPDAGTTGLSYTAICLHRLGYMDQARQKIEEMLALAQQVDDPLSLARALFFAAILRQLRRQAPAVFAHATAAVALSEDKGFSQYRAMGKIFRGWAMVELARPDEGMAEMRDGLGTWRTMRGEMGLPYYLALLAEAHRRVGEVAEGLEALDEALALVDKKGERQNEAELHRIKGELLLSLETPDEPQAEACFTKAAAIARRQQAKSWELRAVMSLGRLWQRQGEGARARTELAKVYGWFTEGFDTADLHEAKALLEVLGDTNRRKHSDGA
jgi:adenylate cyclase